MTNCEDCVYYEYDPEADTNYCEADLDEDGGPAFPLAEAEGEAFPLRR